VSDTVSKDDEPEASDPRRPGYLVADEDTRRSTLNRNLHGAKRDRSG
jgi:hypothetical protein